MKTTQAFAAFHWRSTAKILLGVGVVAALVSTVACTGSGAHRSIADHGTWGVNSMETMTNIELRRLDATAEQKQQISVITKNAAKDLQAFHDQHDAAHDKLLALLTAPKVDRDALEALRASELELADQASRRITVAVADIADILNPSQREKLAQHFRDHMRKGPHSSAN